MGMEGGRHTKSPRELLRAAVLAASAATSACATDTTPRLKEPPRLVREGSSLVPLSEPVHDMRRAQFRDVLEKTEEPSEQEIFRIEKRIARGESPLLETLVFFERGFSAEGWYTRAFNNPALTMPRLSEIMRMVDSVSVRLNRDYALRKEVPSSVPLFSHMPLIQAATKKLSVPTPHGDVFCNSFLSRNTAGEIFQDTAAHCGPTPHDLEQLGFFVSSDGSDAASRRLSPKHIADWGLTQKTPLPLSVAELTPNDVFGKVVVSYSMSPRGDEKVHFSIALPFTEHVRKLYIGEEKISTGLSEEFVLFMLKPAEEGKVIARNTKTGAKIIEAQGSSGSGLFVASDDAVLRVGSFTTERVIEDTCAQLCYGISTFNLPHVHTNTQAQAALLAQWQSKTGSTQKNGTPEPAVSLPHFKIAP